MQQGSETINPMPSDTLPQLSEREREILRLVATGATNQQIAAQLNISANTVKVHLRNIFGKIGVASRTEATVYAIKAGLVSMDATTAVISSPPGDGATLSDAGASPSAQQTSSSSGTTATRRVHLKPYVVAGVVIVLLAVLSVVLLVMMNCSGQVTSAALEESMTGEAKRWQKRSPMPAKRSDFAVAAYDGYLYVIGGVTDGRLNPTMAQFDPLTDQWTSLGEKPTPVSHIRAVTVGRRIYIPGGEDDQGNVLNVFEAYDPVTQEWEQLPPLPEPRSRYALVGFDGRIYVMGGWNGSTVCADMFIYDPATKSWSAGPPLPTARLNADAAVIDRRIYVIGGTTGREPLRTNEYYDEDKQMWRKGAPLTEPVASPATVGIINRILVFDAQSGRMLQYTPMLDEWTSSEIPPNIMISSRAILVQTSIFVFGAEESDGFVGEYQAIYNTFLPGTVNQ